MSRINKITVTVASVFAVFVLLSFGAGWFMLDYALKPAADAPLNLQLTPVTWAYATGACMASILICATGSTA